MPYRFLIADGDVHPVLAGILENAREHFPNLDLEYVRYPDDRDFSCYFAKMADALGRVTTPYAMLADNDDFLAFTGLERAIDFLESNADYVCSAGRVVGFSVYSGLNNPNRSIRGRLNRLCTYFRPEGVTAPRIAERLREGSLRLWIYYAVTRTEALAGVCRDTAKLDFSDLLLFEAFHVMRVLTLGKARSDGSVVSYLRQYGTSLNLSFKKDWVHHLLRSQFTSDVHALVDCIANNATAVDGDDPEILAEGVRKILEIKFRRFFRANYNSFYTFKKFLRAKAPGAVRWFNNRPRYFIGRERTVLLQQLAAAGASQQDIARFRAELVAIEEVVSGDAFAAFLRPYRDAFDLTEDSMDRLRTV